MLCCHCCFLSSSTFYCEHHCYCLGNIKFIFFIILAAKASCRLVIFDIFVIVTSIIIIVVIVIIVIVIVVVIVIIIMFCVFSIIIAII